MVDNGQHVLAGCYYETFPFLDASAPRARVACSRRSTSRSSTSREGVAAALPAVAVTLAPGRRRLALARHRLARSRCVLRPAGRAPLTARAPAAAPPARDGRRGWRVMASRRGCEMLLGAAGGGGAEPGHREALARAVRARPCSDVHGPDPRGASLGVSATPLDEMFADPAKAYIEARGGEVRMHSLARVIVEAGGSRPSRSAASGCPPAA